MINTYNYIKNYNVFHKIKKKTLAKPTDCITNAFKMHLLTRLMQQLSVLHLLPDKNESDFVEISHLLLDICTSQLSTLVASSNISPTLSFSKKSK